MPSNCVTAWKTKSVQPRLDVIWSLAQLSTNQARPWRALHSLSIWAPARSKDCHSLARQKEHTTPPRPDLWDDLKDIFIRYLGSQIWDHFRIGFQMSAESSSFSGAQMCPASQLTSDASQQHLPKRPWKEVTERRAHLAMTSGTWSKEKISHWSFDVRYILCIEIYVYFVYLYHSISIFI